MEAKMVQRATVLLTVLLLLIGQSSAGYKDCFSRCYPDCRAKGNGKAFCNYTCFFECISVPAPVFPPAPPQAESSCSFECAKSSCAHLDPGTMQNFSRASRVLVNQGEASKGSISTTSVAVNNDKKLPQKIANRGAGRLVNVGLDQRKDSVVEIRTNPQEDSSLTPPSIIGTVINVRDNNTGSFERQQVEAGMQVEEKKESLAVSSSLDDLKNNQFSSSDNSNLTFQKGQDQFGNRVPANDQDSKQHDLAKIRIYGTGEAHMTQKRDELRNHQSMDQFVRSAVVGSACATTMSVHSGPPYQCTNVALAGHSGFSTQMSSAVENMSDVPAHSLPLGQESVVKEADGQQHQQQSLQMCEGIRENMVSSNASHLKSQVLSANNPSANVDVEPSQSSKVEKAPRKKKYDPDVFFKVNGKLYQKLGKIGSGGSSEVHKVITSDCTIYALKKIKLKGRDYPTAYGFCQEIEYLNKLKGKGNIIQLIDHEVTDKTLLQEVINGSMTVKDGRIKDDQYIH
ncbi:uncharacterized protein A4U43_C03F14390 [Asparagus officinalis]|uniref:Protein kinase domain-containing protein n=1 Tax=Asparagus officinalis TaxID=4686 RepID=A0A5P1FE91_ASPOF|nr:uncharacterized protein A4U43_C03F14390 [Asparagus officinalis]